MSVSVLVIREDPNGDSQTLGDIVIVPSEVCDISGHLARFTQAYLKTLTAEERKTFTNGRDGVTWDMFFRVPNQFRLDNFKTYGISSYPLDVTESIHVHGTEAMLAN